MVEEGQGWSWSLLHRGVSAVATLLAVIIATAGGVIRCARPNRPGPSGSRRPPSWGRSTWAPRAAARRVPDRPPAARFSRSITRSPGVRPPAFMRRRFPEDWTPTASTWCGWPSRRRTRTRLDKSPWRSRSRARRACSGSPCKIHPEWTPIEVLVDWPAIGALKEVVVSVNPAADGGPAVSSIAIDGRFEKLPVLRKLSMSPLARLGGVLLASLLVSMLMALLRAAISGQPGSEPTGAVETFPVGVRGGIELGPPATGRPRPGRGGRAHRTPGDRDRLDRRQGAIGGRLGRPGNGSGGRSHRGVVEIRAHRPAPHGLGSLSGHGGDGPAGGLRQLDGDPPGTGRLVRAFHAESNGRRDDRAGLPRGQRLSTRLDEPAPGRSRRRR